jgi:hypothetical protein
LVSKEYLRENMVVVTQKDKNRKKVPIWARIEELDELLN